MHIKTHTMTYYVESEYMSSDDQHTNFLAGSMLYIRSLLQRDGQTDGQKHRETCEAILIVSWGKMEGKRDERDGERGGQRDE